MHVASINNLDEGAQRLCDKFALGADAKPMVLTYLQYIGAARFKMPYAEGRELALARKNGKQLREIGAGPDVSAPDILGFDAETCDQAGMLEMFDRCGAREAVMAMGTAAMFDQEYINVGVYPSRVDPVEEADILMPARESLFTLFRLLTGVAPSKKRDFVKKKGKLIAVAGSPADFVEQALKLGGWKFTSAQLVKNYQHIPIKRSWER